MRKRATEEKPWFLYLLFHVPSKRTYIGITHDPDRRLKQHRGQIPGGARYTKRLDQDLKVSGWILVAYVTPLFTRSEATRWERLVKIRSRGLQGRLEALRALAAGQHPPKFTDSQRVRFPVPGGLSLTCFPEDT